MKGNVSGYEKYIVTLCGMVISLHGRQPRALSPHVDKGGYMGLTICGQSGKRRARVHRLVAETYLHKTQAAECVRHLDGDKLNNKVTNLKWGTYSENEVEKISHGTWHLRRTGKLNLSDRMEIRKLSALGFTQRQLSDIFTVTRPTITRLLNGTTWGEDK